MLRSDMPASLVGETPRPFTATVPSSGRFWPWLPLCLAALLYLAASVGPALYDQNEAQYAGAVREMLDRPADYLPSVRGQLERGHWYVPTNDGVPRLQKPPLVYWALLASMSVFGVNEFAARLPNALASLAWFAGIFVLGRRVGGVRLGRAGATILATMAGTFIFCHLIAPEPFLAATLTWTFWCFLRACDDPGGTGPRWILAAWVGMALGVMCKGLHGALYPLAVVAILAWQLPATRPAWKLLLRPAGVLVFVALVVPWYAAVAARYPGFLYDQFINEQLGHVFNRRYPPDSSQVPLYVFWPEHLIFFLPWTFFAPAALAARRAVTVRGSQVTARALLVAWFVVTAASVTFSSMQDYYLMTAWGPVALWLARPWAAEDRKAPPPFWTRLAPGAGLALLGAAAFATALWLHARTNTPATAAPSALRDTLASTVSGISLEEWRRLLPLVWATGAACALGGAAALWLAGCGRWRAVLPATAAVTIVVLGCAARGLVVLEDHFSLKELALISDRDTRPDSVVACAGTLIDNPSILFYTNRAIYWVGSEPMMDFATRQLGIGRSLYLSDDEFLRRWSDRSHAVYLIVEHDEYAGWRRRLSPAANQEWRSGTRIMMGNGGGEPPAR
ncbi:MAG: glycosyltransferase family 39 protein [Gluconacetobacter diazotrophicus]|nr:glycosyltransferase family 39 protein [Gluconacetobacter diazotrophicus]